MQWRVVSKGIIEGWLVSFPLKRGRLSQHPTEFRPSLALLSYSTYGRAGPRPFERLRIMQKIIHFFGNIKSTKLLCGEYTFKCHLFLLFRCRYHHHLFCSSIAGLVKWKLRISWANGKQIMVLSAWHHKIHSHNSPF